MLQDLRFGLRMLRRNPGFAVLAILCLTLGVGANAAVFSWIEGLLLRPYPLVKDLGQVFVLSGTSPASAKGEEISWPDFGDLRRSCTLVDAFIAEKITGTTLSVTGDRAERAPGSVVSANYFDALGVRPILGRSFEPVEETGRNAHPVVVVSYQLWKDHFGGDPDIVGRTQMMNGVAMTIIGVAPPDFYGTFVGYKFQFWVPASMQERFDPGGYKLEDRSARWIEGFVRLKPGVTRARAEAEISAVAARLAAQYPVTNRARGVQLLPLWESPFNPMDVLTPTLGMALAVVTAILLIACANVGNLLLLKSFARRREMTIRLAIGARRGRLVRQLVTEGLILAAFGIAGGLLVAHWSRDALVVLFPPRGGAVMRLPADLDWRVVALSVGVCALSTLVFGLAPAILSSSVDLVGALKSESSGVIGGHGRAWVRSSLVLVQVSLSFVLLAGGALVVRSLTLMRAASPGFSTREVSTTGIDLVAAGYDPPRARVFQDELLARLASVAGVESAAFARVVPFSVRGYSTAPIAVDGFDAPPDEPPMVDYDEIGPGYLSTMGIPLVEGREFTRRDDETSEPVGIVNEAMAAHFWRGQDPVNRRLVVKGRSLRVVGVARTAKYESLLEPTRRFFYVPLRQTVIGQGLVVRTRLRPETLAATLARETRALDPNVAPSEVITLREQVARTTSSQSMAVTLLMVFGGLGLLLSTIGLYGVMASAVSQSVREFAVRQALGASPSDLVRLVMARGLALAAAGLAVGAGAAFELTRLLGHLLYGVGPRDPVSFGTALVVMAAATTAACVMPAWRAARLDPNIGLRA